MPTTTRPAQVQTLIKALSSWGLAVSWSKRAAVAVSRQFRTCTLCVFEEECDITSSLIGNSRWCVVERVCTGRMSGNSELAHRVYSKVGVRHNSGVHISRSALWASAWAVVDVEPTHDIKKRNSLSITQLLCSLQKFAKLCKKVKKIFFYCIFFYLWLTSDWTGKHIFARFKI